MELVIRPGAIGRKRPDFQAVGTVRQTRQTQQWLWQDVPIRVDALNFIGISHFFGRKKIEQGKFQLEVTVGRLQGDFAGSQ